MFEIKLLRMPGFKLNPKDTVVNAIFRRLDKTQGECPCHHDEWDENTPHEDKVWPCKTYRDGKGCHCALYVEE